MLQVVELRCGVQCGPDGNDVRLGGLPNLRRCRLTMVPRRNSRNGVPVMLDEVSLSSLQHLQVKLHPPPQKLCAALGRHLQLHRLPSALLQFLQVELPHTATNAGALGTTLRPRRLPSASPKGVGVCSP